MQTRADGGHTLRGAQRQVQFAHPEVNIGTTTGGGGAAPRTRRGQVAHDGACAHGAHVKRAGGRCVGNGQDGDLESFQDVDHDYVFVQTM